MTKENQITTTNNNGSFLTDPKSFEHTWRVATAFSKSQLVPTHFQNKPEDCMVALMMANQLNIDPYSALQNLQMIKGKVAFSSAFAIALANDRGSFAAPITWDIEGKGESLVVTAKAKLKKTGEIVKVSVSMETAKKEGWTRNTKYQTMPEQMLRYRSATWLIRLHCPEVLLGMQASDEITDVEPTVNVGGSPVDKINAKVKEKINITEEANKLDDTNTKLENVITDSVNESDDDFDPFN
tara:strand:+ start:924 stop:1643 length:720 start_codon:yes stop_codon:yes gene_type:complete